MLAIQPLGLGGAEEELRPVGVGSSVGHGQDTCEERSIIQNKMPTNAYEVIKVV